MSDNGDEIDCGYCGQPIRDGQPIEFLSQAGEDGPPYGHATCAAEPNVADEPADGTALYWPETGWHFARLAIRDDAAALDYAATVEGYTPEHRWWAPNSDDGPITWAELTEQVSDSILDVIELGRQESSDVV